MLCSQSADSVLVRRANICLPRLEHLVVYGGGAIIHAATNKFSSLNSALDFYLKFPCESAHRVLQVAVEESENYLIQTAKDLTLYK